MSVTVRAVEAADRESVEKLAREYRFADQRGYRRLGHDFAADWCAWRAGRFLERDDAVSVLASEAGEPVGWVGAAPLAWETSHFDVPMAQLTHLVTAGSRATRLGATEALLAEVEARLGQRGIRHVCARIDLDDTVAIGILQERGYRVMDTIVTYLGRPGLEDSEDPLTRHAELEPASLSGDALRSFDPHEVDHLAHFMRSAYRLDRFHADRRLDAARSDALYVEWFRRVFRGEWADAVHVVRKQGRIVGFCSEQFFAEIAERYGLRIVGRGLAGVMPEGQGGYAVLTESIQNRCPFDSAFQEFDTQIQNHPVINVWVRRRMPFLGARSSLHRWLDERPGTRERVIDS